MLIKGPVSLKVLEYEGRTLMFFGDSHIGKTSTCDSIDIVEVLHQLLSNYYTQGITTDVYLEQRYTKDYRDIMKGDSYLADVNNSLIDCLKVDKKECKYSPYVRVHYSDIRIITTKVKEISFTLPTIGAELIGILNLYSNIYNKSQTLTNWKNFLKCIHDSVYICKTLLDNKAMYISMELMSNRYTEDVTKDELVNYTYYTPEIALDFSDMIHIVTRIVKTKSKTGKQLYKLNPNIRSLLREFIFSEVDNIQEFDDFDLLDDIELYLSSKVIVPGVATQLRNRLMKFYPFVVELSSLIMDTYTLSRILYHNSSKVITYTGHNHTKTYFKFFTNYIGATIIEDNEDTGLRCIKSTALLKEM